MGLEMVAECSSGNAYQIEDFQYELTSCIICILLLLQTKVVGPMACCRFSLQSKYSAENPQLKSVLTATDSLLSLCDCACSTLHRSCYYSNIRSTLVWQIQVYVLAVVEKFSFGRHKPSLANPPFSLNCIYKQWKTVIFPQSQLSSDISTNEIANFFSSRVLYLSLSIYYVS